MATVNPFGLLGDDDADDPSLLIQKVAAAAAAAAAPATKKATSPPSQKPAKLPSKPLPPTQAVREAKNDNNRGGGRGFGRGLGRGRGAVASRVGGYNRDFVGNENSFKNSGPAVHGGQGTLEGGEVDKNLERRGYSGPRTFSRGGRRGGFNDGEVSDGDRPRRIYERHSGTGRGNEFKREGAGRGNWGSPTDEIFLIAEEVNETEKAAAEKPLGEENAVDGSKGASVNESEEKEPEDKEMTLEEYEKVLDEKRKALLALKTEERKVDVSKEFGSMQLLSNKKSNDDVFIKLGSDKDKRKEASEKDEKTKKSVSINEFLKPADGERYRNPSGRGRGRGRSYRGDFGGNPTNSLSAPSIEDPGQFPTLGGGK